MHLWIAGRGPNNSSLFPPLAAVVVVAPDRGAKQRFLPLLPGEVALRSNDGEVYPFLFFKIFAGKPRSVSYSFTERQERRDADR